MGFRFGKHEPIRDGARRVAMEELAAAEGELLIAHENPAALHEVRKRLKRLRALLALARPAVGKAGAAEDEHLKLIARALARHRETDAFLEVLAAEGRLLPETDHESLQSTIRLHDHAHHLPSDRTRDIARARRLLAGIRRRLGQLPLQDAPPGALRRRCRKTYKRARREYAAARASGTPDAFHEWRKVVKALLNQLRLLRAAGGPRLTRLRHQLVELDARLGRARDCAMLASILRGVPAAEHPLRNGFGLRASLEETARAETESTLRAGARLFRRRSRSWAADVFD